MIATTSLLLDRSQRAYDRAARECERLGERWLEAKAAGNTAKADQLDAEFRIATARLSGLGAAVREARERLA